MKIVKLKHFVKSLVEIGAEQSCFDNLLADLKEVEAKINENFDLVKFLNDAQIPFAKKKKAVQIVFGDFIGKTTYNFLFLLIKNNQLNWLNEILREASNLHLKNNEIIEVVCESVVPLDNEMEKDLRKIFENKLASKIVFKNILNDKLLGGLRIRINDTVIDSSLRGKIERLREKIDKFH